MQYRSTNQVIKQHYTFLVFYALSYHVSTQLQYICDKCTLKIKYLKEGCNIFVKTDTSKTKEYTIATIVLSKQTYTVRLLRH